MKTFEQYFEWLIPWEGSTYENVPSDRGGPTKYGIDAASHPDINIRALTKEKARAIYLHDYWVPVRANDLPWPLNVVMMDIAVNNGRTRAVQWLQKLVGVVVDGVFGPKTMAAVKKNNPFALARLLLGRREVFYWEIAKRTQRKFLKGWLNRNNSLAEFIAT